MQQEDHPEHNMPEPEHKGTTLPTTSQDVQTSGASLIDRTMGPRNAKANSQYRSNMYKGY